MGFVFDVVPSIQYQRLLCFVHHHHNYLFYVLLHLHRCNENDPQEYERRQSLITEQIGKAVEIHTKVFE